MSSEKPKWETLRDTVRAQHGYPGSDQEILLSIIDAMEEQEKKISELQCAKGLGDAIKVDPKPRGRRKGSKNKPKAR